MNIHQINETWRAKIERTFLRGREVDGEGCQECDSATVCVLLEVDFAWDSRGAWILQGIIRDTSIAGLIRSQHTTTHNLQDQQSLKFYKNVFGEWAVGPRTNIRLWNPIISRL